MLASRIDKPGTALTRFARGGISMMLAWTTVCFSLAGCRNTTAPGGVTLVLAAYTTPREAYDKDIIPAFQRFWKDKTGAQVTIRQSYQGSGAQSRAVIAGFEADVAALSLEDDIDKIQQAGLITHDWRATPNGGIVTRSIVVIAVRRGNPKGISDWPDLARSGVNVLTPDPSTSGGAQWNINAIYGAGLRASSGGGQQGNDRAAAELLKNIFKNVSAMDKGARESITTFEKGIGDAAITYENEVLVGRQAGETYDYIIPHSTILIQNPVALVDENADRHGAREVAEAFVQFLWSKEAQRDFANYGLRPVDADVAVELADKFPAAEDLWTIDFLGGWKNAEQVLYGPEGVYTKAIEELRSER